MKKEKKCCKTQMKEISIDNLILNKNSFRYDDNKDMLYHYQMSKLIKSIGENGFFKSKPLFVIPALAITGNYENKYIVIDGNLRLLATKVLSDKSLIHKDKFTIIKKIDDKENKYKPKKIPCIIYDTAHEIYKEIGYDHIQGIELWTTISKARYFQFMLDTTYMNDKRRLGIYNLSTITGCGPVYINNAIVTLKIFDKLKNIEPYRKDTIFYEFFDMIFNINVREYLNIDMKAEDPLENIVESNLNILIEHVYNNKHHKEFIEKLRET